MKHIKILAKGGIAYEKQELYEKVKRKDWG